MSDTSIDENNIERFVRAQEHAYNVALDEINAGQKRTHWMWFIFPQLRGLGYSDTSWFYGIDGLEEAKEYMKHDVLGPRLLQITNKLKKHTNKTASDIFGYPDDLKLRSCMTLFEQVSDDPIFGEILDTFFDGKRDELTLEMLNEQK